MARICQSLGDGTFERNQGDLQSLELEPWREVAGGGVLREDTFSTAEQPEGGMRFGCVRFGALRQTSLTAWHLLSSTGHSGGWYMHPPRP